MKRIFNISIYKKLFPFILSVLVLTNSFSFMFLKNFDFVDVDDVCAVSSISKYYNLISLLPIKIVTDFLNIDMNISCSIGVSNSRDNSKKQSDKRDKKASTDFVFTISNYTNLIQSYNKLVKNNLLGTINSYNFYCSSFYMLICFFSALFIFVFKGSMTLARGDTENNIIINKIQNKVIRLV